MSKATLAAGESQSSQASVSPLFPLSGPSCDAHPGCPLWLRNTSFIGDLSAVEENVKQQYASDVHSLDYNGGETNEEYKAAHEVKEPEYAAVCPLVESHAPDRGTYSNTINHNRKHQKKRRRGDDLVKGYPDDVSNYAGISRKSNVRSWTRSDSENAQDSYFDSRGDVDNMEFGCLYRMDVARYKRHVSNKFFGLYFQGMHTHAGVNSILNRDVDCDALDNKLKSGGRYWSSKYTAVEYHKGLKRIRIDAREKVSAMIPGGPFVPLIDIRCLVKDGASVQPIIEESWDDEVLRKTREFNKVTREQPHNAQNWLSFAEFQDKVASMQPQKAARIQTAEKKLSILEKAVELNPGNEELLLSIMRSYSSRDSADIVISKWEKILSYNTGNYKLWNEFLHASQSDFSRYKVTEMRKIYSHAIQAIFTACKGQSSQAFLSDESKPVDPDVIRRELGLVDVFIGLCRLEWQAGYRELTTALFQAEIEYSLLCPSLILTENGKKRLFEHFWNEGGARVGEEGALGWSSWLQKEETIRNKIYEDKLDETGEGGLAGWINPLPTGTSKTEDRSIICAIQDAPEENFEQQERKSELDTETLFNMIGHDFDPESASEFQDPLTWKNWSEEEASRDRDQWMPLRVKCASSPSDEEGDQDDEHWARTVLFEDISDYIFSLASKEAFISLISQFIDFFGGKISDWPCTNSSSWIAKSLGLEAIPETFVKDLKNAAMPLNDFRLDVMEETCGTDTMTFLYNAILLCLPVFPRNRILQDTLLVCEEKLSLKRMDGSSSKKPLPLAKCLLKNDRQDVVLCGVYARRVAVSSKNLVQARGIFDMALSSLEKLPLETRRKSSPLLYFWYAEVEAEGGCDEESRAVHILCCLGSDARYTPYQGHPSNLQILKAHQGFKERLKSFSAAEEDGSMALVCSAALFEELTSGLAAGLSVLEQALLSPAEGGGKRMESLINYYARTLQRHHHHQELGKQRPSIMRALELYPFSPQLHGALMVYSRLYDVPSKLRLSFDTHLSKYPSSVTTVLFALAFELGAGGGSSKSRIRGLLGRAVEDERMRRSILLWRCFIAFEMDVACDASAAKKVFFRAVHACPWSKTLWLDGFHRLSRSVLSPKELSDLHQVMRDKELNIRTDIYEILLRQDPSVNVPPSTPPC